MLYLILAIVSSSMVSIVMRASKERVKNNISLLVMNYGVCLVLACAYTGIDKLFQTGSGLRMAYGLGLLNGLFCIGSFVLFQYNVKKNGVVLSAVFMKLGVLVPTILSITVFQEHPGAKQLIGLIMAIAAILIVNLEKPKQREAAFKVGLLVLLLGNGCADGMSKVFRELADPAYEEQFLLITFIVACTVSVLFMLYKKQRITFAEVGYGMLLGIPNYYSARFLLKALGSIPAFVAYPTFSVATIGVISLAGIFLFREQFTKKQVSAMCIIAVTLVLLN